MHTRCELKFICTRCIALHQHTVLQAMLHCLQSRVLMQCNASAHGTASNAALLAVPCRPCADALHFISTRHCKQCCIACCIACSAVCWCKCIAFSVNEPLVPRRDWLQGPLPTPFLLSNLVLFFSFSLFSFLALSAGLS